MNNDSLSNQKDFRSAGIQFPVVASMSNMTLQTNRLAGLQQRRSNGYWWICQLIISVFGIHGVVTANERYACYCVAIELTIKLAILSVANSDTIVCPILSAQICSQLII